LLNPSFHVVVDDLINHCIFKGFTDKEEREMQQFYSEMLKEWDQTKEGKRDIEELILFIRGSKLPISGWRGVPNIIFQKRYASDAFFYPVAHTCTYTLDIQPYSTKEEFEEGIRFSLNAYRATGGAMSMA
jgi:hypothetical protein